MYRSDKLIHTNIKTNVKYGSRGKKWTVSYRVLQQNLTMVANYSM
jgi:hypothetical protein